MNPIPWAQPKIIAWESKPGTSQKKHRAAKIASSIQLARFTQGQRAPGIGLRIGSDALGGDEARS
jgi:hypothetical protein